MLCANNVPLNPCTATGKVSKITSFSHSLSLDIIIIIIIIINNNNNNASLFTSSFATPTGCGKKVTPCRILQIFKQPLGIF